MKNIIRVFYLSLVVFASGCNDKLDLQPIDIGSVDGFYTSTSDVVAGVNGIYNTFTGSWWGGAFIHVQPHFMAATENSRICCAWEYQYKQIAQGTMNSSTGGVIRWKWDFGYQAIFRINGMLEVLGSGTIEDLTTETANKLEGELKFLRAYVYNELTFLYGDVPLVQTLLTPTEARDITRAPRAAVETAMYADIQFAIDNLDTTPFQGEFGRPTKQAALALKGRAQIFRNDFSGAAASLALVIEMEGGVVALDPDYESLFRGENEQSPEIIWALQYVNSSVGAGEGNFLGAHYGPTRLNGTTASAGQGWGAFQFTNNAVDAFDMTDGKRFDQSPLYDAANPFDNRDSRFAGTWFYPGTVYRGVTLEEGNFFSNGAKKDINIASRKWADETSNNSYSANGAEDFVLIRYADVLLMHAEAVNEVSGPTPEVYEDMNKIRARAVMPDVTAGLSQDQMRDEIKHERNVEFMMEGTRYFDLLRWRDAETVLLMDLAPTSELRTFDPGTHYRWPIPQFAIDQSAGLTQNPGY